ncbi:hypothetical protein [Streptomyces sp. NPDC017868]
MERSGKRRSRRGDRSYDWVELVALALTAITAIAGCVERFM